MTALLLLLLVCRLPATTMAHTWVTWGQILCMAVQRAQVKWGQGLVGVYHTHIQVLQSTGCSGTTSGVQGLRRGVLQAGI